MKIFANLLLFLFVTFLSTPTIVSVIEKNCDTSVFYTMSEEEETHKELKVVFERSQHFELADISAISSKKIISGNQLKHDHVFPSIFIPPPDQI